MMYKDVIELFSGVWTNPIVLVNKKDGSLVFCQLQEIEQCDNYPLPRIDDTFSSRGKISPL